MCAHVKDGGGERERQYVRELVRSAFSKDTLSQGTNSPGRSHTTNLQHAEKCAEVLFGAISPLAGSATPFHGSFFILSVHCYWNTSTVHAAKQHCKLKAQDFLKRIMNMWPSIFDCFHTPSCVFTMSSNSGPYTMSTGRDVTQQKMWPKKKKSGILSPAPVRAPDFP